MKHPPNTEGWQLASLACILDSILSFLTVSHNNLFFEDVGACSSLDFALRVFTPCLKLSNRHLIEVSNYHAGSGRTFSESDLWTEEGTLVACMTQQVILRVPVAPANI